MDVRFADPMLATTCNKQARMVQRWGRTKALRIGQILFELLAAESLSELASLPHLELQIVCEDRAGPWVAISVDGMRIEFTATILPASDRAGTEISAAILTEATIHAIDDHPTEQRSSHGK